MATIWKTEITIIIDCQLTLIVLLVKCYFVRWEMGELQEKNIRLEMGKLQEKNIRLEMGKLQEKNIRLEVGKHHRRKIKMIDVYSSPHTW